MLLVSRAEQLGDTGKIHRHCLPRFVRTPNTILGRRMFARIDRHNWRQNEYAIQSRISNQQRVSIRSERRQTLHAVCKALVFYTCYDPAVPHQFECWADIPYLAKQIDCMYLVDAGGLETCRYDTVINALVELENMEAVLIVREYCHQTKKNKLNRVYLMPVFFRMFGFSDTETYDLLKSNKKKLELPQDKKARTEELWAARIGKGTRAQIRSKAAARRIDQAQRKYRDIKPSNDSVLLNVIKGQQQAADHGAFEPTIKTYSDGLSGTELDRRRLRRDMSVVDIFTLQSQLLKEYPGVRGEPLEQLIDEALRERQRGSTPPH